MFCLSWTALLITKDFRNEKKTASLDIISIQQICKGIHMQAKGEPTIFFSNSSLYNNFFL